MESVPGTLAASRPELLEISDLVVDFDLETIQILDPVRLQKPYLHFDIPVAAVGMPLTSKFGNASTRNTAQKVAAKKWWVHTERLIKAQIVYVKKGKT